MPLFITLFIAGMLTILLPCILPLIPIVLGVSIAGRSKLRPLFTILGMIVSFVGFTFLLVVVLRQFVEFADYLRIGTYYVLLLFGLGFFTHDKRIQFGGALVGGPVFFLTKGAPSAVIAAIVGVIAMQLGGRVATAMQQWGSTLQAKTRQELGTDNPLSAFVIGLTMGLVWVPCAGPALGFAFTLVREEPGLRAFLLLLAYAAGTGVPLLLIGYGGQAAVHSVRALSRYSGRIKQVAGAILIMTALSFNYNWLRDFEIWLVNNTGFGNIGVDIEMKLFGEDVGKEKVTPSSSDSTMDTKLPKLAKLIRAPEFQSAGPWHNSEPFTLESLKGKVVLIDFWTYSCINCIRTLPYIQGYWDKFKDNSFVLLGVHTPEFVFEQSEQNVAQAIRQHGLTYPVVQDNDYGTWRAFANRYWPAKYLIDAEGYVRYTHFGEGAYEETDLAIQSLLAEIDETVEGGMIAEEAAGRRRNQTPETYMGERSWSALGNGSSSPTDNRVSYSAPSEMQLHKYYLVGDWQMEDRERQVLRSETGEIRMKFLGSEINLVMGLAEGAGTAHVEVEVDGEQGTSFDVDFHDLYNLFTGEYGEHEVILRITGEGAEGYAFTFGSN